jgi:hypothetical protein
MMQNGGEEVGGLSAGISDAGDKHEAHLDLSY